MAAGDAVSAAVTASGDMYAWGFNDTSMLGIIGDDGGKGGKDGSTDEHAPRRLTAGARFGAAGGIAVSLGGQHAAWLVAEEEDAAAAPHAPAAKMRRDE